MQTIIRLSVFTIFTVLFISCASRIPVNKPAELTWWIGKSVRMLGEEFNLVPNYAGRGAAAWKDSTAYVGENYPLRLKPGHLCQVVRFYREKESEGSHVFAVLRTTVADADYEFELMFLPDYRTAHGRNDAEKVAYELLRKPTNGTWQLAE